MKSKFKYIISLLLTFIMILSSTLAVNAASWSVAEELGFEVERTNYDSYCWINERSSTAKYNGDLAGVVYYQTCACREKTLYLNQYSKFTQMTRTIAEPSEVEVTYKYFLWIDQTSTLRFQIDTVEMYEGLVDGQRICDYFATSPALDADTVVTQGWTIGTDQSFSIKDIEFGGSGSGTVSFSSNVGAAESYNSTKVAEYFNVRFNFRDFMYETGTQEQENLAYNQCSFYTGVSYYGLPSVMEEYSHTSSYKVVFSGYYVQAYPFAGTSIDLVPGSATATDSFTGTYHTY